MAEAQTETPMAEPAAAIEEQPNSAQEAATDQEVAPEQPDQAQEATVEAATAVGQKRSRWDDGEETGGGGHNAEVGAAPIDDSAKPTPPWPGHPGENIFRLLVPVRKVGSIIGKKGAWVKAVCEETKARVKILEGVGGTEERVVLISAREDFSLPVPPAMQALLRVHTRVVEGGDEMENDDGTRRPPPPGPVTCRLLVAATQAGSVIGRQGATVKGLKEESGANIRVLPQEEIPLCAMPDDRVVEMSGAPGSVVRGLELVSNHLRRFLHDRSVLQIFEQARRPMERPPMDRLALERPPMDRGLMERPPVERPLERMPLESDRYMNGAGMDRGMGRMQQTANPYSEPVARADHYYQRQAPAVREPEPGPQTLVTPAVAAIGQVIQRMTVPVSYADSIIGAGGAHIAYIRRTSGASVTVHTTDGAEMAVEMRGSAAQVHSAQQLVQDFMAGAVVPSATTTYTTQAQSYSTPQDTNYATNTSTSSYGQGTSAQPNAYGSQGGQSPYGGQGGQQYGGQGSQQYGGHGGQHTSYSTQGAQQSSYGGSTYDRGGSGAGYGGSSYGAGY